MKSFYNLYACFDYILKLVRNVVHLLLDVYTENGLESMDLGALGKMYRFAESQTLIKL